MENKDWNPDEWQGRSEKQVQNNDKLMFWCIIGGVIFFGFCFIYWVLSKLV